MTKITIILFALLLIFNLAASAKTNQPPTGQIEVSLYNFESDDGNVRVHLYNTDTKDYFPSNSSKCIRLIVEKIKDKSSYVVFDNLPYGSYALAVHHDENLNIKMDRNFLGMPTEGWGLSNNIIPVFKLPSFDDCKFELNDKSVKVFIKMRNL